jgi:hypothetical protein
MKKLNLATCLILSGSALFSQIPTGSLTGYWPFSGNANDLSGNSNNGAVTGCSLIADRFGNCDMAYSFDGVNNKIVVPNAPSIDMSNGTNFSVCFWMNTYTGISLPATMICKNLYGSNTGYQLFSAPGSYCNAFPGQLSFYTAPSQAACSNTNICAPANNNTWFFIVGVYNATANIASMYVNGVLQSATGIRSGSLSTSVPLYFGSQTNSTEFYKGALDDIRIYKRILTQTEITNLYNDPNPGPFTATVTDVTPPANQTVCVGNSATLSAISGSNNLNWYSSLSSTLSLGNGTNYVTPTLALGTYTYYAKAVVCNSTVSAPVSFSVISCTGIYANSAAEINVKLYPNPNDGNFAIETGENSGLKIVNIYGQIILAETLLSGKDKIDLSKYPRGIYFGEVKQNNISKAFKFIIE